MAHFLSDKVRRSRAEVLKFGRYREDRKSELKQAQVTGYKNLRM